MLCHLTSALLLLAIIGGQWLHTGILMNFIAQQDFISKTLCIKKDETENTCNGTCHLRKQMKETQEQQEELPQLPKEELIIVYCSTAASTAFQPDGQMAEQHAVVPHLCPLDLMTDLLRPPQLV